MSLYPTVSSVTSHVNCIGPELRKTYACRLEQHKQTQSTQPLQYQSWGYTTETTIHCQLWMKTDNLVPVTSYSTRNFFIPNQGVGYLQEHQEIGHKSPMKTSL